MTPDLISLNQDSPLLKDSQRKDGNREAIRDYIAAGCIGSLTDKQMELFERWRVADEVIRKNTGKISRSEMAEIIAVQCNVSYGTAKADMSSAEDVFSSSLPLNKKYLIQGEIEYLQKQMRLAGHKNDFKNVAAIGKVIAAFIDAYPDTAPVKPRRQIIFNLHQNVINNNGTTTEDADIVIGNTLNLLEDAD